MTRNKLLTLLIVFSLAAVSAGMLSQSVLAADVTLESLLQEMTDRAAIAEFPDPYYTCKQASSYDRRSVSPDQPGWYANGDTAQFIREEMNGDRKEWVLMDAEGPGAIVRWWITAPRYHSTFRIYLDGSDTPAIEAKIDELIGGDFLVGAPLSAEKARGRNLYLPIPYAKHCKVTVDDLPTQGNLYYQINYRTYEKDTKVESFSMAGFSELSWLVEPTQNELSEEFKFTVHEDFNPRAYKILKAGESETIITSPERSMAIDFIDMHLDADDLPQALRSTLICISFDGKETVRCPVGDFFGSGVGINPYQSRYTAVGKKGCMESRWFMPYQSKMEIKLVNLSEQDVKYYIQVGVYDINWHPNMMYFHCNWRQQRGIETKGSAIENLKDTSGDWNYISIKGKGVFAGDSLTLLNRHTAWWGEGDEKIYVDGEKFPSHFGTGTEDYYGYAWCTPEFFEAPFHAQPRAEGPSNFGNVTNSRYRSLDAIPFQKDFRFDMELWHWAPTVVDYAVTTYWYALGDATTNQPDNIVEEAKAKVKYETDIAELIFKLTGYIIANRPRGNLSIQHMGAYRDKWHDDQQLWWTGANRGDELQLTVDVKNSGKQKLVVGMTKAIDYGIVQFSIDGKDVGQPVDLFNDGVVHSGMIEIGTVDLTAGEHTLGVKIVGKNEKSTNYLFGMDKFEFAPAE